MSKEFYKELAPVYHLKVDWENRKRLEKELFRFLLDRVKPKRVLDVGCGDGGHASWFLPQRVEYIGVDLSREMIRRARTKYSRTKRAVFFEGDMTELSQIGLPGEFDLILNLGNSLPHLLEGAELDSFMEGCSRVLADEGAVLLQSVNPLQLRNKNLFFPTPRLEDGWLFSPIYIRRGKVWEFTMQIYKLSRGRIAERQIIKTMLRLWSAAQLRASARKFGLKQSTLFGSAKLEEWNSSTSKNIVMLLERDKHA